MEGGSKKEEHLEGKASTVFQGGIPPRKTKGVGRRRASIVWEEGCSLEEKRHEIVEERVGNYSAKGPKREKDLRRQNLRMGNQRAISETSQLVGAQKKKRESLKKRR